jgi:D-3-phosphoglycerate dehydrogenase
VMGTVGALLGQEQINIEAAQISQELDGRASIMVLRVDRVPDQDLLDRIGDVVEASAIRGIAAT